MAADQIVQTRKYRRKMKIGIGKVVHEIIPPNDCDQETGVKTELNLLRVVVECCRSIKICDLKPEINTCYITVRSP